MSSKLPAPAMPASRRAFFSGAATVGVAAAVATVVPTVTSTDTVEANALPPAPDNGGGYTLSEHVKRYYQTASV